MYGSHVLPPLISKSIDPSEAPNADTPYPHSYSDVVSVAVNSSSGPFISIPGIVTVHPLSSVTVIE